MLDLRKDGIGLVYVFIIPAKLSYVFIQVSDHLLAPIDLSECAQQELDVEVAPSELLDLVAKSIHDVKRLGYFDPMPLCQQ